MSLAGHPGGRIHTQSSCVDRSQAFPEQLEAEGSLIHQAARSRRQEFLMQPWNVSGTFLSNEYSNVMPKLITSADS